MVSPSTFYKLIQKKGYKSLVDRKIIPSDESLNEVNFNNGKCNPNYKMGFKEHNDTNYGKIVEDGVVDFMVNYGNSIFSYLPGIKIDDFKKLCDNMSVSKLINRDNKVNYDLMYRDFIIDVKTYKNYSSFTSVHNKESFVLQLSIYYSLLEEKIRKKIKYLAIYNPLFDYVLYFKTSYVDHKLLMDLYKSCNNENIVEDHFKFGKRKKYPKLVKKMLSVVEAFM